MKKFFNEPEMNISLFSQADIVTASGEGEPDVPVTNANELAKTALNEKGVTKTISFTW